MAVGNLPEAMPRLFERYLGHSLDAVVAQQLSGGGTLTENWLTSWGESIATIFDYIVLASVIWAIANLLRRHAVWSNALTLVLGLGWVCILIWAT